MRLATISDIHIRSLDDEGHRCLKNFARHPLVKTATHIGLLGDIFDLMAGDHWQYEERWKEIFEIIHRMCAEGKTVIFAEGNHDMHLTRLFQTVSSKWPLEVAHRLQVIERDKILEIEGKKVLIGHGDEYNRNDTTYLWYKGFIKRKPLVFVANHVMPLWVLDLVGQWASKKSRKYGQKRSNEDQVKDLFHQGIVADTPSGVDVVIGGHTHIVEEWKFNSTIYLNNGYPPVSGVFAVVDQDGPRLVELTSAELG